MIIKYWKKENGNYLIDFANPPAMQGNQFEKFCSLLDENHIPYEIVKVEEKEMNRTGHTAGRKWSEAEDLMILDINLSQKQIEVKTGRKAFSVFRRRGPMLARFIKWCIEKNLNSNDAQIRKRFIEEGGTDA